MNPYNKKVNMQRNPRNFQTKLFQALTKLLSGPIVNRHQQMIKRLRSDQLAAHHFTSLSGQDFKTSRYSPLEHLSLNYYAQQNRMERYAEFDQMEFDPIISACLNLYADEITTSSEFQEVLKINCPNQEIKTILHELFYDVLNIEYNAFWWARNLVKYGDHFLYLDIDNELGITSAVTLPVLEVERLEGLDKTNPNYVQFQWNAGGITFENWQVAHFRLLGNDKYVPYGTSVLDPARRIFRQLYLMEEAMLTYRVVRSSERRVFYIDVGGIDPKDVGAFMEKAVSEFKRATVMDEGSGRADLRYNPIAAEQDYFVPTRGGNSSTKIETLQGGQYTGVVDDIEYLLAKLFGSLNVPQSYLMRNKDAMEDATTLAQKDIRFSRSIQRIQRSLIGELNKIALVHLFTLGFKDDDLLSFSLSLNNPSRLASLQELEYWKSKFDAASSATENFFSNRWIARNIFNLSEDEFERIQRERFYDKNQQASLETTSAQQMGPLGGMGGGPSGPGGIPDLGLDKGATDEENPMPELGGDIENFKGDDGNPGGGEEDILLAQPKANEAPGRREDGAYLTPGAKNKWYHPAERDHRSDGARTRSYRSLATREMGTNRTIFPGRGPLSSFSKGIFENKEMDIINEEKERQNIINSLEGKKNENKAQ